MEYKITVSSKIEKDGVTKKYQASKTYDGPKDLQEALAANGESGVFEAFMRQWRTEKGNDLRAKLFAKVQGEETVASDAEEVQID